MPTSTLDEPKKSVAKPGVNGPPADPPAAVRPPRFEGEHVERLMPELIEYAAKIRASDLYCFSNETDVSFAVRHLGIVRPVGAMPADVGRRCLSYIKTMADMNITERRKPSEGRWFYHRRDGGPLDLRVSSLPTLHGEDCTVRILDQREALLSIDQLGLHAHEYGQLVQFLQTPSGLILVTGPTESGKTTTLYAGLSYLNTGERKINTIEEPIEYSLPGIRQSQANQAQGLTFDLLLRSVLRQAPDVIMIGEIREEETALTAVRAAASGHLVLATLHAPVASAAVHSMIRLGVNSHVLAHSLLGVVSQRLVRTLCPHCRETYPLPQGQGFEGVRQWLDPGEGIHMFGTRGCAACQGTGYIGRTGLFEILRVGPEVRPLIDAGASVAAVRTRAVQQGMLEFRHAALIGIARGVTSLEEVVRVLPLEFLSPATAGG